MKLVKRWRSLMALTALMGALAMIAPAGAQAAGTDPEVRSVAKIVVVPTSDPNTAQVIGVYRCFGGEPIHLWVSVKQGGPDPTAEGSGSTSRSWYDTNIAGAPDVTCDGRYHSITVTVVRHPDKAQLRTARAWVQFCLVSNQGIVASMSQWDRVVKA